MPDVLACFLVTLPVTVFACYRLGCALAYLIFGGVRKAVVRAAPTCTLWHWDPYTDAWHLRLAFHPQRLALRMGWWRLAWWIGRWGIIPMKEIQA